MAKYTLILIADRLLARAEVRGRREVNLESLDTIARPERASLTGLIQSAIALNPKPCNKVWLFSTELWTGSITIPSDLHGIVNSEELMQSALIEAELQSEISAFQSKVAMKRIEDDNYGDPQYWATQISSDDIEAIDQTLRASHTTWSGIAHPAFTCPSVLSHQVGDFLNGEAAIREWAIATARSLPSIASQRPCLIASPKSMSERTQIKWATAIGAMTILACGGIYLRDLGMLSHYESSTKILLAQKEEGEMLTQSVKKNESSIIENQRQLQTNQQHLISLTDQIQQNQLEQMRQASHCLNLMNAVAESSDEESWLQKIDSSNNRVALSGVSLNEASAHRFAHRLELHPDLVGYSIWPAETKTLDNELIEFAIVIEHAETINGNSQRKQLPLWEAIR